MFKSILVTILVAFQLVTFGQEYKFYALSNNPNTEKSLYLCKLNSNVGIITIIERYSGLNKADYLALSSDNKHLLATNKNEDNTQSGIAQFDIADDGLLTFIDTKLKATTDQPCYVSFTPDMNYALSANYGDDEISLYSFANNKISSEIDNITKSDNSKGHFICTDPSGKFVHAVFLGLDKIFNYTIENNKFVANTNQESFSVTSGFGPRHMVFHPNKDFVYIVNETNSSVTACSYNSETGVINKLQNISMLPSGFTGNTHAAAIRIHPNGNFLYASNRGHNSIAVYEIASDGKLTFVEHETFNINFPRDFNISTDGKFMIIANQKGSSIMSLRIDENTGELNNTGMSLIMTSPVSITFLPTIVDDTTDINSIKNNNNELIVFPNPVTDVIQFNLPEKETISKIELYSMNGQLVKTISDDDIHSIDVSELPIGTYLLIANSKTNIFKQIIVLE